MTLTTNTTGSVPARTESERLLKAFEITNLVLVGLAVAIVHLTAGPGPMLTGVLVGGAIGVVNIRGMIWLGGKIRTAEKRSKGFYVVLFGTKMALVMTAIWLALSYLPIQPIGLLIGFSTVVPSVVLMIFKNSLAPARAPKNGEQQL